MSYENSISEVFSDTFALVTPFTVVRIISVPDLPRSKNRSWVA